MIKHFVIFKFTEGYFKQKHYDEYVRAFDKIKDSYSGIKEVHIRRNCISRPANMDLMIEMDVDDEAVLGAYLADPEHVRMGKKYNPHVINRVSFDYVI